MAGQGKVAPARRRGLAGEVADRIREAIFNGAYAPGAQLREVELSTALDVSRGPVREALLLLEREGLVHSAWHRGVTVTELEPGDVAELDTLRDALDGLAVRTIVSGASDEDLAAVEKAAERMARAEDEHAMVRRDIAFHDAVYAASGHRRLQEAWQAIRSQVHLFLLTRIGRDTDGYLAHIPGEHRELAAALRARDAERALELFADHRRLAFDVVTGAPGADTAVAHDNAQESAQESVSGDASDDVSDDTHENGREEAEEGAEEPAEAPGEQSTQSTRTPEH